MRTQRPYSWSLLVVVLAASLVATACGSRPARLANGGDGFIRPGDAALDAESGGALDAEGGGPAGASAIGTTTVPGARGGGAASAPRASGPGPDAGGGTVPAQPGGRGSAVETAPGVTDDKIRIVYYYARQSFGEASRLVPDANFDDGQAITAWVKYFNAHANGGATLHGFPFNLHGRNLELTIVDSGTTPEANRAAAERIVKEIKPFAAITHSTAESQLMCPILASAGILNIGVWSLNFDMYGRSNGYCFPGNQAYDESVEASKRYLANRMSKTQYQGPEAPAGAARRYGIVYTEYADTQKAVPVIEKRFRDAGVNIVAKAGLSTNITQAQQQATSVVAAFKQASVNTIIMPETIAGISFTQAAESQGFFPDYYMWPCMEDVAAIARLYNAHQWERASGLTCFDPDYTLDLGWDANSRASEWWGQYQSVDRTENPPTRAPLIYMDLATFAVGVTGAGRDLRAATFRTALERFEPYRYSYRTGRTANPVNMLIRLNQPRIHSTIGDFAIAEWNGAKTVPGSTKPGAIDYPDGARRYNADQL